MNRSKLLVFLLLLTFSTALSAQKSKTPSDISGRWDAVITNASKIEVPFGLSIVQDRTAKRNFHAAILNGSERLPFTSAAWNGNDFKMRLEQYEGVLSLHFEGAELRGEWVRQTAKGVMHYPVHAAKREAEKKVPQSWKGESLAGEWVFTFEGPSNTDKVAPAEFKQTESVGDAKGVKAKVEGTIAPVSGDYGLLGGEVVAREGKPTSFRLSRFDGIHIVLVSGELLPDGSLRGKLNTQGFTAVRKDAAKASTEPVAEADAEAITRLKDPSEPFRFKGVDPKTGKVISENSATLKGKPLIIDIFGTWCPNCHDEAPVLVDLYKRYREQGLEIVGLAYEYVDDPKRNARVVDVYRKKYGIEFPLLLAGTTDEGQIAKTLPQLEGFGAYPTTIFVGRDGKVQKIHAGFAGPATGERFTETKRRFEENVKALLAK